MQRTAAAATLVLALLGAACAPGGRPANAPAAEAADTGTRLLLRPVPVPASYRAALERGTRAASGAPGPRYWQQRVSYAIQAELDPATQTLRGRERITYANLSPVPVSGIVLNLYQNVFAEGVPRNRFAPVTGGITLERVAAQGRALPARTHEEIPVVADPGREGPVGYAVRGTLARVVLPRPLAAGDSTVLEVEWRFLVPPAGAFRTAWEDALGGRVFQVGQWYPQVAVLDDVRGWDATPYLGDGEFYLEYGDFDVALTLPAGWLVGATGELRNPEEVLAPEAAGRLAGAGAAESVTRVVTADDLDAGRATLTGTGGKLTWRFAARDVRDFAFSASDRYAWDAIPADVAADGAAGAAGDSARAVLVHALYRPGAPGWEETAGYAKHALELYSRRVAPYAYPQVTVAEGPIVGGMEYPQLVFVGREEGGELYDVTAHEVAHQWFPMVVGQDEAAFAWMDEGLAEYLEGVAREDLRPESRPPWAEQLAEYAAVAGTEAEVPLMRHTDQVGPFGARTVAVYEKPALLLRSLRGVLGDTVFARALGTYAREWRFRHPYPWDFFATVERVAGRDLDWFWYPQWWETGTLDYAVERVEVLNGEVRITVRDLGDVPAPVAVVVTSADGATARAELPVELWTVDRLRSATLSLPVYGAAARVEIDPEHVFPDVNPENNVWTAAPPPPPGGTPPA